MTLVAPANGAALFCCHQTCRITLQIVKSLLWYCANCQVTAEERKVAAAAIGGKTAQLSVAFGKRAPQYDPAWNVKVHTADCRCNWLAEGCQSISVLCSLACFSPTHYLCHSVQRDPSVPSSPHPTGSYHPMPYQAICCIAGSWFLPATALLVNSVRMLQHACCCLPAEVLCVSKRGVTSLSSAQLQPTCCDTTLGTLA